MSEANVEWACEIAAKYAKGTRDERIWWEDVAPMLREVLAASALREAADGPSEDHANDFLWLQLEDRNKEVHRLRTALERLTECENMAEYEPGYITKEFAARVEFARAALSGGEPHEEKKHDKLCAKLLSPNNTCTCVSAETAAGWAPQGEPPK